MIKVSANFEDKNRIREWLDTGASPAEISRKLLIEVDYIERYAASLKAKSEPDVPDELPDAPKTKVKKNATSNDTKLQPTS